VGLATSHLMGTQSTDYDPHGGVFETIMAGCVTADVMVKEQKALLKRPDIGSVTSSSARRVKVNNIASLHSRFRVRTLMWGFRTVTGPNEVESLCNGRLLSKAQALLQKDPNNETRTKIFWLVNGPDVSGLGEAELDALRFLAIQSSDVPKSQFVSVALDLPTAHTFGDPVYAFKVQPLSPVFGLRRSDCSALGEIQFQVLGGTPITDLWRYFYKSGQWESFDMSARRWFRVSRLAAGHPPTDSLLKRERSELR